MKLLTLSLLLLTMLSFTVVNKLTDAERIEAIAELTTTHDHLLKSLNGLSEAQLNFKVDANSWSIAECTEHIAISETNIFGMLKESLKTPADASRRSEVKHADEDVIKMAADRTNKVKTSKPFEPSGKYGSFEGTVKAFKKSRKANMQYVATTNDDLRNHYAKLPVGTVDAYQVLLFMSGHTERHILQIEEIIANPDFPKE